MNETSGSRVLRSGVGTQMLITSISPSWSKSFVAEKRLASTIFDDGGRFDVADVGAALGERADLGSVDVEARHPEARVRELHREREVRHNRVR